MNVRVACLCVDTPSYKGSLTAESISEYLTKRTAVQPASDHQATVKVAACLSAVVVHADPPPLLTRAHTHTQHMLPTNEALHRFHALANEYLEATPQRRDKIMRLVQRTRDAIALQPYGYAAAINSRSVLASTRSTLCDVAAGTTRAWRTSLWPS